MHHAVAGRAPKARVVRGLLVVIRYLSGHCILTDLTLPPELGLLQRQLLRPTFLSNFQTANLLPVCPSSKKNDRTCCSCRTSHKLFFESTTADLLYAGRIGAGVLRVIRVDSAHVFDHQKVLAAALVAVDETRGGPRAHGNLVPGHVTHVHLAVLSWPLVRFGYSPQ